MWSAFARALEAGSYPERQLLLALALVAEDFEPLEGDMAIGRLGPGVLVHAQWPVGSYRLDFAFVAPSNPLLRLAVEVDGEAWHSGWREAERDRRRDRELVARGWAVVRFAAREVLRTPISTALEVVRLVNRRAEMLGPGLAKVAPREQLRLRLGA